jgi:Mg-chelatase subunit ChlD
MRYFISFFALLIALSSTAQSISVANQKSLNNYIVFINESVSYITPMMKCLQGVHQDVQKYQTAKNSPSMRYYTSYQCSKQLETYYYETALKGNFSALNTKTQKLWEKLQEMDKQAKEIELSIRLKDYEKDNFEKINQLLQNFNALFRDFRQLQEDFAQETYQTYRQSQPSNTANPYLKTEKELESILSRENKLLKSWTYNFNAENHTGWVIENINQNVKVNEDALRNYTKSALTYPANTQVNSLMDCLEELQKSKRSAIDDYTRLAQQSDEHSNYVYTNLLNYYNNCLVSFYNNFVNYSSQNGAYLLYQAKFSPVFEFKTAIKEASIKVKSFEDIPYQSLNISKQTTPISQNTFIALGNYLDFINQVIQNNRTFISQLKSFNSSANRYKDLTSYEGKGKLTFYMTEYKIPLSEFEKATNESKFIPASYQSSLNDQAQVILNILKEMDELMAEIHDYTGKEQYKKDNTQRAEEILKRYEELFEILDTKKERLYQDIRKVYESYKIPNVNSSWQKSGKALLRAVDLSRDILYDVKKYFKSDTTSRPKNETLTQLNEQIRTIISNEYDNMKGINRIGRYNGLCPYNPYEDLPNSSKLFMDRANEIDKIAKHREPYQDYIYPYNEMINDYNKFTTLSEEPLLKNITQPEFFVFKPAQPKENKPNQSPTPQTQNTPSKENKPNNPSKDENQEDFIKNMDGYAHNNLVLLLDVSASMNSGNKLPLLKKSLQYLLDIMRPEDQISIVTYSGNAKTILKGVSAIEKERIMDEINNLKSSGETDGEKGLQEAYKTAQKNFKKEGNNRIVMATDGEFPMTLKTYELIDGNAKEDITLSIFSFGNDEKEYEILRLLSQKGKGNYEHINAQNAKYKLVKEAKSKKL